MSAAARAQRRAAAWKTGQYAATAVAQAFPPCKRSTCPMTDPNEKANCAIKRQVESDGSALAACPVALVYSPDVRERYVAAIENGEARGLAELAGTALAAMQQLAGQELAKVQTEGLAVEAEIFGPDGDTLRQLRANPRAEPLLKLLDMLGFSATHQAITPRATAERKADEGIGSIADFLQRRRQLAAAAALEGGADG